MFTRDRLPPVFPPATPGDDNHLMLAMAMGFASPEAGITENPFDPRTMAGFIWDQCFKEASCWEGGVLPHGYFSAWVSDGVVH